MQVLALLLGCLLDSVLGEPRRAHPLSGFGMYAKCVEKKLHRDTVSPLRARLCGVLALLFTAGPFVVLALWLTRWTEGLHISWLIDAVLLYFALGARSLAEHARAVAIPLMAGDLETARTALARIVSRDTRELDTSGVAAATLESVLENGNDAIFGALFWFALLGGPGALMFRLVNTLDAMWGYRTPHFVYFGWAAARLDDVLNYLPARITALCYATLGHFRQALHCWRHQAYKWDSPNAGPVMAAGAGALGLRLGGRARYHGAWKERPVLGRGAKPTAADIEHAIRLVRDTQLLLCAVMLLGLLLKDAYVQTLLS